MDLLRRLNDRVVHPIVVRKVLEGVYSKNMAQLLAGRLGKRLGIRYITEDVGTETRFSLATHRVIAEVEYAGTAQRSSVGAKIGDRRVFERPVALSLAHRKTQNTGVRHIVRPHASGLCVIERAA
jgi:hypothetical protein